MSIPISVKLPQETFDRLSKVEERLGATRSQAVRMAIEAIYSSLLVESPEIAFSGDEELVALKWEAVRLTRDHKAASIVAHELKVTRDTIETWVDQDPMFAQLMDEAWAYSIDIADQKLWHIGVNESNPKALFGTLNAHHELYGPVRRDYIEQQLIRFVEKDLLPILAPRLSGDDYVSIQRQLAAHFGVEDFEGPPEGGAEGEPGDPEPA
jgi:hypothetical protein